MRGGDLKSIQWAVAFTLRRAQSCGGSMLQVRCQSAGHVDITIHQAVKKSPSSCRIPLLCVFSLLSSLSFRCCDCSRLLLACQPAMTSPGQRENIRLSPHSTSPQPHTAPNMFRRCSVTASGEHREALFCSSRLTFSTGTHPCFKCSQCLYQTCSFVSN